MILSFEEFVAAGTEAVAAMNGSATRLRRKDRRIIRLCSIGWFVLVWCERAVKRV
jgi:hypothetical protein